VPGEGLAAYGQTGPAPALARPTLQRGLRLSVHTLRRRTHGHDQTQEHRGARKPDHRRPPNTPRPHTSLSAPRSVMESAPVGGELPRLVTAICRSATVSVLSWDFASQKFSSSRAVFDSHMPWIWPVPYHEQSQARSFRPKLSARPSVRSTCLVRLAVGDSSGWPLRVRVAVLGCCTGLAGASKSTVKGRLILIFRS
jgi:hypothetical protein